MEDLNCPRCGELTVCDSVDIGVGVVSGPAYCNSCGWSSDHNAGTVIDGWYHDAAGGAIRVGSMIERLRHLGGDAMADLATEAFKSDT